MKRFKDVLKTNMKKCNIDTNSWDTVAQDRTRWKACLWQGSQYFESQRQQRETEKWERRNNRNCSSNQQPKSVVPELALSVILGPKDKSIEDNHLRSRGISDDISILRKIKWSFVFSKLKTNLTCNGKMMCVAMNIHSG